jgi:Zn-dependent M28 family amino/carboxypeptidase
MRKPSFRSTHACYASPPRRPRAPWKSVYFLCSQALAAGLALQALSACSGSAPKPDALPSASAAAPQTPSSAASADAAKFPVEAEQAAQRITGSQLHDYIAEIASDKYEGRAPGTRGDAAARAYLIEQLKALGLKPGDGEHWEQPFDLVGVTSHMPERWTFTASPPRAASLKNLSLTLAFWNQYIATTGNQAEHGALKDAELVFVGYGIRAPEYQWDDFKGQDLRGKLLVMLNNDPDWDPQLFAGETRLYYGRWTYKYESAAAQGAAGAIIIHTTPSAGYPFSVVQSSWSGEQFELPRTSADGSNDPRLQLRGWLTEDAARALAHLGGHDLTQLIESAKRRDFKPVSLGVKTSIAFSATLKRTPTANLFGTLEGSDPTLAREYVIYTAHHDHLGIGKPDARGDTIYNGALDNGAGIAQVLSIANAFKALPTPPRRSIMFLFVAAEEQGLLGSQYFVEHSPIPHRRIAADVNYDGGNIWGRTRDVTYIGRGKSSLTPLVDEIAARQGRVVKPDQFPDRGYPYRSDQLNFNKAGVPSLKLSTGTELIGKPKDWGRHATEDYELHHYHQPSDELQPDWNFDGMVEDAQLGFWTGYVVANQDDKPAWTPGDEFAGATESKN